MEAWQTFPGLSANQNQRKSTSTTHPGGHQRATATALQVTFGTKKTLRPASHFQKTKTNNFKTFGENMLGTISQSCTLYFTTSSPFKYMSCVKSSWWKY